MARKQGFINKKLIMPDPISHFLVKDWRHIEKQAMMQWWYWVIRRTTPVSGFHVRAIVG